MTDLHTIPVIATGLLNASGQPLLAGWLRVIATDNVDRPISYQPYGGGQAIILDLLVVG